MFRIRLLVGIIAVAMGLGVATPAVAQGAATPVRITFADWDRVDHASAWSRSVEYAAGFTTGFGEGALGGATAIASGAWRSVVFLPKLAMYSDYRQGVWNSTVSGAKAAKGFTETAVTDPRKAADELGSAWRGAWDELQTAYSQAAAAGRGSEFIGQMAGQGAVLMVSAYYAPTAYQVIAELGECGLPAVAERLSFIPAPAQVGWASTKDYAKTFYTAWPKLEGKVYIHHAIERQVLTRFPGLFSEEEIDSLENLRGIPKRLNPTLHLADIRREWDRFYRDVAVPTRQQVLDKATEIDAKYGAKFNRPVRGFRWWIGKVILGPGNVTVTRPEKVIVHAPAVVSLGT